MHLPFVWHCREANKTLSVANRIHIVQLKNFEVENDTIEDAQASWVRFFKEAKDIDLNQPPEWITKSETLSKAVNILSRISRDREEYLYYEDRKRARRETVGVLNSLTQMKQKLREVEGKAQAAQEQVQVEAKRADVAQEQVQVAQEQVQAEARRVQAEAKRADVAQEQVQAAMAEITRLRQLLAGSAE